MNPVTSLQLSQKLNISPYPEPSNPVTHLSTTFLQHSFYIVSSTLRPCKQSLYTRFSHLISVYSLPVRCVPSVRPILSFVILITLLLYSEDLLTPWCRVLLEKLTGLQLVKKFPAFHRTRKFITALTSVRHLSLSCASPIQSIYPHPTSWRSSLILSTHLRLGLPSGLLPSGFPTKTLYTPLSSPIRATCPAHLILFSEDYKL